MTDRFKEDVAVIEQRLAALPVFWEGKASVLALKEANYQWGQMEWWAFYFEHLCFGLLKEEFTVPGEKYTATAFDLKRSVNWDLKAKAIKSDDHKAILNDKSAMQQSIEAHGEQGLLVALCDVEYNDIDRSFQQWHTELRGGDSAYTKKRKARTSVSRYRKTQATLQEILILRFTAEHLDLLGTYKQGRNSNGKPRPEKYMLDLEEIDDFLVGRILFTPSL